jgi:hypothetical protein
VDYFDNPGRPDFEPVMSNAVKTPGAIVNVDKARAPSSGKVTLAVMAINSAGMESELSNPVEVDLSVSNTVNSVAPLGNIITPHPPSGSPLSHNGERVMLKTVSIQNNLLPLGEGQRMRVPDTTGPPPIAQGLKAWVLNSGTAKGTRPLARVQWESLGQGWRYNLYYSADADLSNPLKENSAPFDYAAVDWSPDVKGKQYWVAVTAVNSKGEESYHSVPVQVVFQKPSVSILQTLKNTISGARDAEGTASSAKNLITNPR